MTFGAATSVLLTVLGVTFGVRRYKKGGGDKKGVSKPRLRRVGIDRYRTTTGFRPTELQEHYKKGGCRRCQNRSGFDLQDYKNGGLDGILMIDIAAIIKKPASLVGYRCNSTTLSACTRGTQRYIGVSCSLSK